MVEELIAMPYRSSASATTVGSPLVDGFGPVDDQRLAGRLHGA
jgi:hypothetical protein